MRPRAEAVPVRRDKQVCDVQARVAAPAPRPGSDWAKEEEAGKKYKSRAGGRGGAVISSGQGRIYLKNGNGGVH